MLHGEWLLIIAAVALLTEPFVVAKKYNVTIGYLPCIKGESKDRMGLTISGALFMALEDINNSGELLPDVNLLMKWNDTKCNTAIASKLITDLSNSGVVAFFGPEIRCQAEALVAQSRNLPMISYNCFDYQASTLSNFARLNPPETQAMDSVLSLLRYYRWNKFSILYDESWSTAALSLKYHAEQHNMTVNHQRPFVDGFKCCEEDMPCCDNNSWKRIIQETKYGTRIYVFLGLTTSLIDMMTAMESLQLFENGEYMVIFVDMLAYSFNESMKYLMSSADRGSYEMCPNTSGFRKRSRSLLVVTPSEPESSFGNFTNRVRKYNGREPFKFPQPILSAKHLIHVPINAVYLYDAVKLYATALHSLIEEDTKALNETLTHESLMSVATNGSRIVSKMITITPFKSVLGMYISLDEQANPVGNFSVLAFKPANFTDNEINCNYTMIPVGHFQQNAKGFPEYKLNPRLTIEWPNSVKPEDEPSYSFLNKKYPTDDSQITLLVVAVFLAVTLLCVVVCIVIYIFYFKNVKTSTLHKGQTKCLYVD